MSEKNFHGGDRHRRAATKKHCAARLNPSLPTLLRNWTTLASRTAPSNGFAAPRRLALKVANLAASQPDREVEKNAARPLPGRLTLKVNQSKAAEGWARGCGITVDQG